MTALSPEQSRTLLRRRSAAELFSGALLLGALLVAGCFFFVCTSGGQWWDNLGYAGRQVAGADVRVFDTDILQEVTRRSLLVAFAAIFLLSLAPLTFSQPGYDRVPFLSMTACILAAGFAMPAWFAFALRGISWRSLHRSILSRDAKA